MDRLQRMNIFTAVAEAEGFAGGARKLGLSPPAVTRAIASLEAHVGVRLLTRTTRHVRLTEAGARYLEDCKRILAEIDEADENVAGLASTPRGRLVLTAPLLFGRLHVAPVIVEYLERHAEVDVGALFLDRVINLLEEGVDVAIRIGALPDSSFRAITVGQVRSLVVGAPDYFTKHGRPRHPRELAVHRLIGSSEVAPSADWRFREGDSSLTIKVRPRYVVNSNETAVDAAIAGFGLARVLSYQSAAALAAGTLKTVLDAFAPPPVPIHLVHPEGRQASAKVRAFIDLAVSRLRAQRSLQGFGERARRER